MLRKIIVLLFVLGAMVSYDTGHMIAKNTCLGLLGAFLILILVYTALLDKHRRAANGKSPQET